MCLLVLLFVLNNTDDRLESCTVNPMERVSATALTAC